MMGLVIMLAIWVVLGALFAALAPSLWKEARPYGDSVDYLLSILLAAGTGLADWYVLPLMGIGGALRFAIALVEPAIAALVGLWVMRLVKRRRG